MKHVESTEKGCTDPEMCLLLHFGVNLLQSSDKFDYRYKLNITSTVIFKYCHFE